MYTRIIKTKLDKSFFLFGPRGTGKTTWVRKAFPDALYLDLLEASLFNDLLASAQRLEKFVPRGHRDWIVIDEVQRVPELLNEVHRLIEKNKWKFVLTGSSARKLRRGGHNLLAGRALTCSFFPLTCLELGKDFDIERSVRYGHLPSVFQEADPQAYLESYVRTYLEEEIRSEGITRNLSAFARFLEAASFSQGAVLNVSSVARECAVERKVVEHYFAILEDLLIAYRIPVFTKKTKRRLINHDKFYFFDIGIFRRLRPAGPLDKPEEIEGAALETLVLQELIALNELLHLGYKVHYWRTSNGTEVDFVLYGPKGIVAIEVKRTGRIDSAATKGLRSFINDYPMARAYLFYGGDRVMNFDGIEAVPVTQALAGLKEILK